MVQSFCAKLFATSGKKLCTFYFIYHGAKLLCKAFCTSGKKLCTKPFLYGWRSCDLSIMKKSFAKGRMMPLQSIFHYGDFTLYY